MEKTKLIFLKTEAEEFKLWLNLLWDDSLEDRKLKSSFHSFWYYLFSEDCEVSEIFERLDKILLFTRKQALNSWMQWFKIQLCHYLFFRGSYSLKDLEQVTGIDAKTLCFWLREQVLVFYSESEKQINHFFLFSSGITATGLKKYLEQPSFPNKIENDGLLRKMESILLIEWQNLMRKIRKEPFFKNYQSLKRSLRIKDKMRMLKEGLVALVALSLIIFLVQKGNSWYEQQLVEKIKNLEPEFSWLKTDDYYKEEKDLSVLEKSVSSLNISDIKLENSSLERFETETAIDFDSVPQDFTQALDERSLYEEKRKGGYRFSSGSTTAYRVMMVSDDPSKVVGKLNNFLKEYKITPVDKVTPGQRLPGGFYYNLYVPNGNLDNFLSEVKGMSESYFYTNLSSSYPGKSKVFIWVKEN